MARDKSSTSNMVNNEDVGTHAAGIKDTGGKALINGNKTDKSRFGFQEVVKLVVGSDEDEEEKEIFFVHSKLLTSASPFFRNAIRGGWKEAEEQCIELPVDLPAVINAYVHFLYTGDMDIESICSDDHGDADTSSEEQMLASQLYTFADEVQDTRAKNGAVQAMNKAVYKIRTDGQWIMPSDETVQYIYENTLPHCLMRKMIVDIFVYCGDPSLLPSRVAVPGDFFFDVLVASMLARCEAEDPHYPEENIARYLEKEQ